MARDAKATFICGRRGSGKSTRAEILARSHRATIAFDPTDEYRGFGYTRCASLGELRDAMARSWRKGFRLAYVPPGGREAQALHHLSGLLFAAQRPYYEGRSKRLLCTVVDEMALSYPASRLPDGMAGFQRVVNVGRHYGLEVIGVSQRPAEVSPTFRGNAAETYIYPLHSATDRATVLQMIGREHDAVLRALEPHRFLHFMDGKVKTGRNPPLKRR